MDQRFIALMLLTSWVLICIFIFGYFLDFFGTSYFSFGPSENLVIYGLNIVVDTWSKYFYVMVYNFIDPLISVYASDNVWPWVSASIYNPDMKTIAINKYIAWFIVNYYTFLTCIKMLFSIGMGMTQIDFFLIYNFGVILASCFTGYMSIRKKEYIKNEIQLDDCV